MIRAMWSGWQVQVMDEHLHEIPAKLKKSTCSVSLPNLTAERCAQLLPILEQVQWIQLDAGVELDAVTMLSSLPALTGIDLHAYGNTERSPERYDELLERVSALPNLTSLLAVGVPGRSIAQLRRAAGLRWLALWSPRDLSDEHLEPLGELSRLEDLRVQGTAPERALALSGEAFRALAVRGALRTLRLTELHLTEDAIQVLLSAKGLREVVLEHHVPRGVQGPSFHVEDQPALERLHLTSNAQGGALSLARLPKLRALVAEGLEALSLTDLPRLSALEVYTLGSLSLHDLPALRRLSVEVGPDHLKLSGTPKLKRVSLPLHGLPEAETAALGLALPGAALSLSRPKKRKRKRTAPKRTLKPKAWTHPHIGAEPMSYAALVVGRVYEDALTLAKCKEIATILEAWSAETDEHLAAIMPFDLSPSGGLGAGDALRPMVVGRVLGLASASEGPSAAIDLAKARVWLEAPLPPELWAEVAGVIGDDDLERVSEGVYLVAAGPLAWARLAYGEVKRAGEVGDEALIRGQDLTQTVHDRGVVGALVDETDTAVTIDLDEVPKGPGSLHLIAQYD